MLFAVCWFKFAKRPFPKYLHDLNRAVSSGLSYSGELVYAAAPRTVNQHPVCYHNRPGVFDIGLKSVYRYFDNTGECRYITVYFKYDMPTAIPSKLSFAYDSKRPDKIFPMHGGAIIRGFKGFKFYIYYLVSICLLLSACFVFLSSCVELIRR